MWFVECAAHAVGERHHECLSTNTMGTVAPDVPRTAAVCCCRLPTLNLRVEGSILLPGHQLLSVLTAKPEFSQRRRRERRSCGRRRHGQFSIADGPTSILAARLTY